MQREVLNSANRGWYTKAVLAGIFPCSISGYAPNCSTGQVPLWKRARGKIDPTSICRRSLPWVSSLLQLADRDAQCLGAALCWDLTSGALLAEGKRSSIRFFYGMLNWKQHRSLPPPCQPGSLQLISSALTPFGTRVTAGRDGAASCSCLHRHIPDGPTCPMHGRRCSTAPMSAACSERRFSTCFRQDGRSAPADSGGGCSAAAVHSAFQHTALLQVEGSPGGLRAQQPRELSAAQCCEGRHRLNALTPSTSVMLWGGQSQAGSRGLCCSCPLPTHPHHPQEMAEI